MPSFQKTTKRSVILATLLLHATASEARPAEEGLASPMTITASIESAPTHYPTVRARIEQAAAASEGVRLAQKAYLPRADLIWQVNVATRNNIFGLLLPQSVVPAISGPVLTTTSGRGALGSAAGALVSWEPIDFGYRSAHTSQQGPRATAPTPRSR